MEAAVIRVLPILLLILALPGEDWNQVLADNAKRFDRQDSPVEHWRSYAQAALETGDLRLASNLVEAGITRFPKDDGLRLLELHVLARSGRADALAAATDARLLRAPTEVDAWRLRAWAAQRLGDHAGACASLEAALLLHPEDHDLRRQLAGLLAEAGLPRSALEHYRKLMPDASLTLPAAICAGAAGEAALGRSWLHGREDREAHLLDARLAVQAGDLTGAEAALKTLVAAGENDPRVLVWAGHLAEQRGDLPTAEAFYARAGSDGVLRLAWLCHRTGRDAEALRLLDGRNDAAARALRQALAP